LRAPSTQQRVRSVVAQVGGYWRPLAAVARLLEELGELGELLDSSNTQLEDLASELADLWIITTAVADQFLGDVAEPGRSVEQEPAGGSITELLAAAGRIARLVNYYDGPKIPRSVPGPSLNTLVAEFHSLLACVASDRGIDLAAAVDIKLDAIPALDAGRFAQGGHDPSTADCLEAFRLGATTGFGPSHRETRLWGGPAWSDGAVSSKGL
jgi:NTP pyrophosphatase (non-canonical NTP hydrolase)